MDFLTVPTATFRVLYVLIVIGHRRREVAWFGVTPSPTAAWVVQQLREAFPFDKAPSYLLFDRARSFSAEVVSTLRAMSVEPVRTASRRARTRSEGRRCRRQLRERAWEPLRGSMQRARPRAPVRRRARSDLHGRMRHRDGELPAALR